MHVLQKPAGHLMACLIALTSAPVTAGERGGYVPVDPLDDLTRAYEERAIRKRSAIPRVSERDPSPEGGPRLWVASSRSRTS